MRREPSVIEKIVMRWLVIGFDAVVIGLAVITMGYILYMMFILVTDTIHRFDVEEVLHTVVMIIIFLEVLELLSMYLEEHHVSMRNVVELGILAMVRKVIVTPDYSKIGWQTLFGMSALMFVMGWIYVQEKRRRTQHEEFLLERGIEPEKRKGKY
ncbi:phosphate-starvation-inducible PsiE family protein [Thermococcus sp.]|uniref:phosphate-starvation-inducible PsiE family protein n=1 Tax=Thermococcus sp. TaxID=35749 RepID=UPI00262C081E|nr:phosphate-starvation-inducible PsiE family protein [Thermococcus sp.]